MSLMSPPSRAIRRRFDPVIFRNPRSSTMSLMSPPSRPIRRRLDPVIFRIAGRPMRRRLDPVIFRNLVADLEFNIAEPEPRDDAIRRLLTTRIHGEGEREGVDFCAGMCVICHNEFLGGENVGVLDCKHEYHSSCLLAWLMRKNRCPLCQQIAVRDLG